MFDVIVGVGLRACPYNMVYDPFLHNRRSIRLRGYDYNRQGAYFVTICTHHRRCHFGEVTNAGGQGACVALNAIGHAMSDAWNNLPAYYGGIEIDSFVLMPNHLHGLVVLERSDGLSVADVVHRFKSWTTHLYACGVQEQGWPPYEKRFWHRNYYERIVRDEQELNATRLYIENNPARWLEDKLNPANPL